MSDLAANTPPVAEVADDGIYSTCPACYAIVASGAGHKAWHESRGEDMNDAHDERA